MEVAILELHHRTVGLELEGLPLTRLPGSLSTTNQGTDLTATWIGPSLGSDGRYYAAMHQDILIDEC
jgi:hypothetical protein